MTEIKKGNKYAIWSAMCFAFHVVASIINNLSVGYVTYSFMNVIFLSATIGMAVSLFARNNKAIMIASGVNAVLCAYNLLNAFSLSQLLYFGAYATLTIQLVKAAKGNTEIKKSWFVAGAVFMIGCFVAWFRNDYFLHIAYTWKVMAFSIVEIVALFLAGMWLKESIAVETSEATAPEKTKAKSNAAKKSSSATTEDVVNDTDKAKMKNDLKSFWIGILLIVLGLGAFIGGIILISEGMGEVGIFMILAGGIAFAGFAVTKSAVNTIKEELKQEKIAGKKGFRRIINKHIAITVSCVVLAAMVTLTIFSAVRATDLNDAMSHYIGDDIDEKFVSSFSYFEDRFEEASWFDKVFFSYRSEYNAMQEKCNAYVASCAESIVNQIDKLEPCTEIRSADHYNEILDQISKLSLSSEDTFEKLVLEQVTNYDQLKEYEQQVESVRQRYRVTCSRCNGSGGGTSTCSSCNGTGKKVVTWYEHGDWGDTSYSSYSCTSCGGDGRSSWSCSCDDGYVYNYGQ